MRPDTEPDGLFAAYGCGHPDQGSEDTEKLRTHRKGNHSLNCEAELDNGKWIRQSLLGKNYGFPSCFHGSVWKGRQPFSAWLAGRTQEPWLPHCLEVEVGVGRRVSPMMSPIMSGFQRYRSWPLDPKPNTAPPLFH